MAQVISSATYALPTTGAPFSSGWQAAGWDDRIIGMVFSDVAGTIYIEQSVDQVNADVSTSYSIIAADGSGISEELVGPYFRIRFVPGSNGAVFRLHIKTTSAGPRQ